MDIQSNHNERKKRIFIGLQIPDNISQFFYNTILELSESYRQIKPVLPENIHMTLKFIGNTVLADLKKINKSLESKIKNIYSFQFDIENKISAFPRLDNASIIYAPIGNGKENIESIYMKIIDAISFMDIKEENKKFIPHITIARLKKSMDLSNLSQKIKTSAFRNIKCNKVIIYESILSGKGANYFINNEISLKDRIEKLD